MRKVWPFSFRSSTRRPTCWWTTSTRSLPKTCGRSSSATYGSTRSSGANDIRMMILYDTPLLSYNDYHSWRDTPTGSTHTKQKNMSSHGRLCPARTFFTVPNLQQRSGQRKRKRRGQQHSIMIYNHTYFNYSIVSVAFSQEIYHLGWFSVRICSTILPLKPIFPVVVHSMSSPTFNRLGPIIARKSS